MSWLGFDQHMGHRGKGPGLVHLMRVGPYVNRDTEMMATWRRGIAAVAEYPNVVMKLGGIGYSATERAAMFHNTAARVYRIDV